MFKVCRKLCVCVLFNLNCRSKSVWHLNFFFVIHKSTVALCLTLCLFFRTFYRKYAYSCYAYKKKLVYPIGTSVKISKMLSWKRNFNAFLQIWCNNFGLKLCQRLIASIDKILISGAGKSNPQYFYQVFRFCYFLISLDHKS